jgi:hypothetical protein
MGYMKKLSLAKEKLILDTYKPEITLQKLAELVGISKTSVIRVLKKNSIVKPPSPKGAKKIVFKKRNTDCKKIS